ncbi:MAG: hypothetical protein V3W41_22330 [Planctomycetota bacterium]
MTNYQYIRDTCQYVRNTYGVPAVIGRRISFKGKPGIIAEDRGNYIGVNFDEDKPGEVCNLHPTYEVEYLDMGKVRQETRSQKRYRQFRECDWFDGTFGDWIKTDWSVT